MPSTKLNLPIALAVSVIVHACIFSIPSAYGPPKPSGNIEPGRRLQVTLHVAEDFSQPEPLRARQPASTESPQHRRSIERAAPVVGDPYLPANELDELPYVIDDISIDPPGLRSVDGSGTVILILRINESGTVDRVETESSSLPQLFLESITKDFYRATFRPGIKDGLPIKTRMRVEVTVAPLPKQGMKPLETTPLR